MSRKITPRVSFENLYDIDMQKSILERDLMSELNKIKRQMTGVIHV